MPEVGRLSFNNNRAPRYETPSGFRSQHTDVVQHDIISYIDALLAIQSHNISWEYKPGRLNDRNDPKGTWGPYCDFAADSYYFYVQRGEMASSEIKPEPFEIDPFLHDPVATFHGCVRDGTPPMLDRRRVEDNIAPLLFGTAIEKCLKHLHRVLALSKGKTNKEIDKIHSGRQFGHSLAGFLRTLFPPTDQETLTEHWHTIMSDSKTDHKCEKWRRYKRVGLNKIDCLTHHLTTIEGLATDRYYFEEKDEYTNHWISPERWWLLHAFDNAVQGTCLPFWEARIVHLREVVHIHRYLRPGEQSIMEEAPLVFKGDSRWRHVCNDCRKWWWQIHGEEYVKITTKIG